MRSENGVATNIRLYFCQTCSIAYDEGIILKHTYCLDFIQLLILCCTGSFCASLITYLFLFLAAASTLFF